MKIRDKGVVANKSVYLVVGLLPDGSKDVLGMWIAATEGAKFWLSVLSELRQRGVRDILVLCADGLTSHRGPRDHRRRRESCPSTPCDRVVVDVWSRKVVAAKARAGQSPAGCRTCSASR